MAKYQSKRKKFSSRLVRPPTVPDGLSSALVELHTMVPKPDPVALLVAQQAAAVEEVAAPVLAQRAAPTAPPVSAEAASLEMLRRQRARNSLVEYARSIDIPGTPVGDESGEEDLAYMPVESVMAAHHVLLCNKVQETMETPRGRLIVMMPPGAAKSTYVDVVAPAWAMSKWKGYRIILASHGLAIAKKQSRKTRALCRQEKHVSIWPERPILAPDQRAAEQWALSNGSEFMAAGLLSGITGNRTDGLIIDDPVATREDADSDSMRVKTEGEYRDSAKTRLKPRGWIIMIMTRWHEADLMGTILPDDYKGQSGKVLCKDGDTWEVLNIPAEAEHADDPLGRQIGDFLWPEWFPKEHWLGFKNDPRGQRTWSSLFQQRPTAGDGIEFKREWFHWYDPDAAPGTSVLSRPKHLTPYGGSDFASKPDRAADFTEHGVAGMCPAGNLYLLDWWSGQVSSNVQIAQWIQLVGRHKPVRWWDEGNVIGHAIAPYRTKAMREAGVFVKCEQLTSVANKALKLQSFQAMAASGRVYLPLKRPWATRLLDQLCAFPAGRYDDAADVCGLIGRGLDSIASPYVPSDPIPDHLVPFSAAWLEYEEPAVANIRYT